MISDLLNLLKNNKKIYAWNVKVVTKDTYELYFIKQKLDMNREVNTNEYFITLYTKEKQDGKEKMGTITFKAFPSMNKDELERKIKEQIELSRYTLNELYTLPKKSNLKPVSKEVGFSGHSLKEAAFIAADALFEADKFDKGYINSSEVFIGCEETKFFDSNGNVFLYMNEFGKIEFITTWAEKDEEVELYKYFEFDNLDTNFIQNQANEKLLESSCRIKASLTPELNNCKVLLTGDYVKTFFMHFAYKVKNDAVYTHISDYKIGQNLQQNAHKADLLSIHLEPTLKNSTKGRPFDDEGIALKRLNIIEKGIIKNFWGSNAVSQYLNKPVFGTYQNVVANAGTLQKEELEEENYLEIITLSDFDIDPITGDFGSEIRLAYLYLRNKERMIVTGGSISGNIYQSLDTVRFSNETNQLNNFIGPQKMLLEKVNINKG